MKLKLEINNEWLTTNRVILHSGFLSTNQPSHASISLLLEVKHRINLQVPELLNLAFGYDYLYP